MKQKISIRTFFLSLSMLLMLATSCNSVRLISEYDEITDKAVTGLQEKISKFFVKMESEAGTPQADYNNYKSFYQDVRVDLNTLQIRADAIERNHIVQDQLKALTKMVDDLETLHKRGFSNPELIKPLRQPFNTAFTAIVKLQMGLKRGEKNK